MVKQLNSSAYGWLFVSDCVCISKPDNNGVDVSEFAFVQLFLSTQRETDTVEQMVNGIRSGCET